MFRFFSDECVNTDIVLGLRKAGVDVLTVREAGLTGTDDDAIFSFAAENKRILLSFDRGFGDIFRFNIRGSSGVIVVLVGQMRKSEIIKIILTFLGIVKTGAGLRGKLAILGKTRIRLINR
ncbi:hypothetical protein COT04_00720 [Candidatus Shapirobacteria bacterium CG07_land_8_20_14_0_80_39_12]|uniref:DUF5615 domain-containing protein n=1 Tax=Candidatus Shapirobacteria bacterium CG07_land_8_20_14_0_80_39_12 TaxID=1974480 RepID=A0A2M6YQB1_9BACT|nr:MAG: hypothetical protein COT04_00720 [Candidatus Shapirobacteria bacterium CG07_land_8_20_14_0_80_39_12]